MGSVVNLGRFVEMYEVQIIVVAMIYLDLVASTAQLLPYVQTTKEGAGDGAGGVEGAAGGSNGAGFVAFLVRLASRFMQVMLACFLLACLLDWGLHLVAGIALFSVPAASLPFKSLK